MSDRNEGRCLSCDVTKVTYQGATPWATIEAGLRNRSLCFSCFGRLVPTGHARVNGRDHPDWDDRKYHKQCWVAMRKHGDV
jgi:hypothetical protein